MTDDEKRRIKGDLLLDFQETKDELDHLRTKAMRFSMVLSSLSAWMKELAEDRRASELSDAYSVTRAAKMTGHLQGFNREELQKLGEDIRATESRLAELYKKKRNLGISDS